MPKTKTEAFVMMVCDSLELERVRDAIRERIVHLRVHNDYGDLPVGDFRKDAVARILDRRKLFVFSDHFVRDSKKIADIISQARPDSFPIDVGGLLAPGWEIWGPNVDGDDPDLYFERPTCKDEERWRSHVHQTFDIVFHKIKCSLTARLHSHSDQVSLSDLKRHVISSESMIVVPFPSLEAAWRDIMLYSLKFGLDADHLFEDKLVILLSRYVNTMLSVVETFGGLYGKFVVAAELAAGGVNILDYITFASRLLAMFDRDQLMEAILAGHLSSFDDPIERRVDASQNKGKEADHVSL